MTNGSASTFMNMTCSIIGSFRKYHAIVCDLAGIFEEAGVRVLSPKISEIIDSTELFVRFKTDNANHSPEEIQLIALTRILSSSFVYVVCPGGYIGRTTCYEIGRVIERRIPLFFSEKPADLPIPIEGGSIISCEVLATHIRENGSLPPTNTSSLSALSRQLTNVLSYYVPAGCQRRVLPANDTSPRRRVVICGSMSHYVKILQCEQLLQAAGIPTIVPAPEDSSVEKMSSRDFTMFKRKVSSEYLRKIRHNLTFGILVVNPEKRGIRNYIGPNTFAEIAVAFNSRKKIYLYNGVYEAYSDELIAWSSIPLFKDLSTLVGHYTAADKVTTDQLGLFPSLTNGSS